MTTKKLVLDLVAFALVIAFLLFFVPFALNATDSVTNAFGAAVIIGLVIGVVAVVHKKLTQKKEKTDEA